MRLNVRDESVSFWGVEFSSLNCEFFGGPVRRMILDTITWQRDSHELFDYESRSIERATFGVESSIRVYRRGAQVFLGPDRDGGTFFLVVCSSAL